MTWVFVVTTVICAAGWLYSADTARMYKSDSTDYWRLYTKVVLQYAELTEQHINLLLRRNT